VLLKGALHLDGVNLGAEPVFGAAEDALRDFERHRLNAGEARLGGDLDHVIELVVVAFACTLHEPGVDFGAELDFAHMFSFLTDYEKSGSGRTADISLPQN